MLTFNVYFPSFVSTSMPWSVVWPAGAAIGRPRKSVRCDSLEIRGVVVEQTDVYGTIRHNLVKAGQLIQVGERRPRAGGHTQGIVRFISQLYRRDDGARFRTPHVLPPGRFQIAGCSRHSLGRLLCRRDNPDNSSFHQRTRGPPPTLNRRPRASERFVREENFALCRFQRRSGRSEDTCRNARIVGERYHCRKSGIRRRRHRFLPLLANVLDAVARLNNRLK